jgi:hypothetical protein
LWRRRCLWYGANGHMASTATLLFQSRFIYADGAIREMVLWKLPQPSPERPHGFKYRLHYQSADGDSVVRYDNETGKGDHCHVGGHEEAYQFRSVETLVADFLRNIDEVRGGATP